MRTKLPDVYELQKKYDFGFLTKHIFDPRLWHFHRVDVARGLALGVFMAMQPIFGHVLLVPLIAIFLWPANLPIAMVSIWITNPAILPALAYMEYKLGIWILGWKSKHFHLEWSWRWFEKEFSDIFVPMILGSLIVGIAAAVIAYYLVLLLWRIFTLYHWNHRHNKKAIP